MSKFFHSPLPPITIWCNNLSVVQTIYTININIVCALNIKDKEFMPTESDGHTRNSGTGGDDVAIATNGTIATIADQIGTNKLLKASRFIGSEATLRDHIYDLQATQSDQFTKTTKEIANYVGRTFTKDTGAVTSVETSSLPMPLEPTNPRSYQSCASEQGQGILQCLYQADGSL
jgi:hypothetical protein